MEFAHESKSKNIGDFIFSPYFNRVKLGEGGLVVFNLFHSIYAYNEVKLIVIEFLISFFAMCTLYGFNDYTDRVNDINNDKKDKKFVSSIVTNARFFILLNVGLSILTMVAALIFLDITKVWVLALLYAINYFYSTKLKSVPVVDIFMVMVWGGLFAIIAGKIDWTLALIVGIMTGIAHLFQMITDKTSDQSTNIKTTVVAMPGKEMFFLSGLCIVLGVALFVYMDLWWALSCMIPIAVYGISRHVTLSWYFSRLYFFICWLALLNLTYGSL